MSGKSVGSIPATAIVTVTDVSPFKSPERIMHYLRRGISRAFLWHGAAAGEAERQPVLRWLGERSRALSQLGAIVLGLHPRMLIVPAPEERAALLELRLVGTSARGTLLAGGAVLALVGAALWRNRRRDD